MCKKMVVYDVLDGVIHYEFEGKLGQSLKHEFLDTIKEKGIFELKWTSEGVRDQVYATGNTMHKLLEAMGVYRT